MKRIAFSLLFILLCLPGMAQKKDTKLSDLVGIWQQMYVKENQGVYYLPIFKEIYADGRYCLFQFGNNQRKASMTNEGTMRITASDVIIEHIDKSVTAATLVGRDNKLVFDFFEKEDFLMISYTLPGSSQVSTECWHRISIPKIEALGKAMEGMAN